MWAIVVLFSMAAAIGGYVVSQEARIPEAAPAVEDHLARNMALYRAVVLDHLRAHPAAPGAVVQDETLPFPAWYQRHPAWSNVIAADGTVVVYATQRLSPTLATRLAQMSQGSMLVGEARRRPGGETYLHAPWHGDTGITLPTLDAGTVVWLARLD